MELWRCTKQLHYSVGQCGFCIVWFIYQFLLAMTVKYGRGDIAAIWFSVDLVGGCGDEGSDGGCFREICDYCDIKRELWWLMGVDEGGRLQCFFWVKMDVAVEEMNGGSGHKWNVENSVSVVYC